MYTYIYIYIYIYIYTHTHIYIFVYFFLCNDFLEKFAIVKPGKMTYR